jgi:hypothetical protein
MTVQRTIPVLFAALLTAGCGAPLKPDEPRPWLEHAGESVESVRYASVVDWQPLGRNSLMIRFEGGRFFLVEVKEPCIGHTREADRIGLDTAFDRRLRINDRVLLDGSACLVGDLRPLDWRAYADAQSEG